MTPDDLHRRLSLVQRYALLLVRANAREPIRGRLWLQKEMFLLSRGNADLAEEAEYEPSLMGGLSDVLDWHVDQLEVIGLLRTEKASYVLTGAGEDCAGKLAREIPDSDLRQIEEVKKLLNDLPKDELLAFLYFLYPEMTVESHELARLMPRRKELAVRLFKRGKVGLEKGAEIAGVPVQEFASLLRQAGILRYSE